MARKMVATSSYLIGSEIDVFVTFCISRQMAWDYAGDILTDDLEIEGITCPCLVLKNTVKKCLGPVRGWGVMNEWVFEKKEAMLNQDHIKTTKFIYQVTTKDKSLEHLVQVVYGNAFEKMVTQARNRWGVRANWPTIFEFGFHIRNGVFHGNKFNVTGPIKGQPRWQGFEIKHSLNGSKVVGAGGQLGYADIILLLIELEHCLVT